MAYVLFSNHVIYKRDEKENVLENYMGTGIYQTYVHKKIAFIMIVIYHNFD